jgi:hypothetical protein
VPRLLAGALAGLLSCQGMLERVKQADLVIGGEYAYETSRPYDGPPTAARVAVVSIDGGGKATVKVLDPGPKPKQSYPPPPEFKRGEKRQVSARGIACRWEDWAQRAAAAAATHKEKLAEQNRRHARWQDKLADRTRVAPERELPLTYQDDQFTRRDPEERESLVGAYITAAKLGPLAEGADIAALLAELPTLVVRDVIAATEVRWSSTAPTAGTVGLAYRRAARLFDLARVAAMRDHGHSVPPDTQLSEVDVAFLTAVGAHCESAGGQLLPIPVPTLPGWVSADPERRRLIETFGWLRVAVAETTGDNLHDPGCRTTRSRSFPESDHVPWWQVELESPQRICAVCNGPGIRDLTAFAGFAAAADAWDTRGRTELEPWQLAAALCLVATTAGSRAKIGEPDITLLARIVHVLTPGEPGEEGWHAYWLLRGNDWNPTPGSLATVTAAQLGHAHTLARERLNLVADQLPPSQRPLPLPSDAGVEALRQRYRMIKKMLSNVPQLDRQLFGLPGAVGY